MKHNIGSSPRMWGTLPALPASEFPHRFIPTDVGNTRQRRWRRIGRPVHPHGCGEHSTNGTRTPDLLGSSPRMWGTLRLPFLLHLPWRFIPTDVGNTSRSSTLSVNTSVHPHGCGEHCRRLGKFNFDGGSSPRMWGTHLLNL